jgi:hypothetical protein
MLIPTYIFFFNLCLSDTESLRAVNRTTSVPSMLAERLGGVRQLVLMSGRDKHSARNSSFIHYTLQFLLFGLGRYRINVNRKRIGP